MQRHPADLAVVEVGRLLCKRRLTSVELIDAHLQRIAERDATVRAFVSLQADAALAMAAGADSQRAAGIDRGPLHGIPFAVKDLIDVAGMRTTCGAHRDAERHASVDAEVVATLRAAGAIPLGKLATYEYALDGPGDDGLHPPPRNPWDAERITGGSSSGSAAAVAARLVRFALGTDTGGSVRSPAACCGVTGFKPTFGTLSMRGVQALAPSLDHVGALGASAEEVGLVCRVLVGTSAGGPAGDGDGDGEHDAGPANPGVMTAGTLRVAYARDWFAHDPALEPGTLAAIDGAASALSVQGARISLVKLPAYAPIESAGAAVLSAQAYAVHLQAIERAEREVSRIGHAGSADRARRVAGYGRQAWASLLAGRPVPEGAVRRGMAVGRMLRDTLDELFQDHDVLLTACTLGVAPPFAALSGDRPVWTPMRTLPFDMTGHPAMACPVGLSNRMPVAAQLVGPRGFDERVCAAGALLERSLGPMGAPPV